MIINNILIKEFKYGLILLIFFFTMFPLSMSNEIILKVIKLSKSSEIIMTIYGNGTQQILSSYSFNNFNPSEVLINGEKQLEIKETIDNLINEENEITLKWDYLLTSCADMFVGLSNIIKIDLSNFDSSKVRNIRFMFGSCISLTSINFNNFDTSLVTNMEFLFFGCYSLISLDLSNFNTKSLENTSFMFSECQSLKNLSLNSFDTSLVTNMMYMFYNCHSLESLYINDFKTYSVTNMEYIFYNCRSLISLDLKSFNTSSVTNMGYMFYNCSSLTSLNLSNFQISSLCDMTKMFNGCNNELIYCINTNNNNENNNLLKQLTDTLFYNNNCSYLCFIQSKKYIFEKEKCLLNCYDDNYYKYEYNNICYSSCPNGTKIFSHNDYLCEEYQNNISTDIKEVSNIDSSNIISTIQTNKVDDTSEIINISYISTSYYSDNYDNYDNTNNTIDLYIDINYFKNLCHIKDNSTTKDDIISKIRNEFNNGNLDLLINFYIVEKKNDLLANENNITYQISSTYNQNNNEYTNISSIDLGECETKLRRKYNIYNNITLLIFKVEIKEEGLLIPLIEYEIYNSETKEKLNLDICENIKINISIPVNVDENNLFKYNLSSEYYNDICFPYTTNYQTDIILEDRRNEFINNNLSLCEEDCEYKFYDINTKKAKCECFIKIKFPLISEISINKNKLLNKFINLKKTLNISILKCYKLVFSKEGLLYNTGSYILLSILLAIIILAVIFKIKGYKLFIHKIKKIIENTISNNINLNNENKILKTKKENKKYKKEIGLEKTGKEKKKNKTKFKKLNKNNPPIKKMKNYKYYNNNIKNNNNDTITNTQLKLRQSNINVNAEKKQNFKNFNISIFNKNKNSTTNKLNKKQHLLTYNDYELNNLSYQKALELDKRKYIEYYISLLKTKHLFIFTFFIKTDYNSQIIKISLFLFSFALFYTVNGLFFTDSTIHKIYEDKGAFDFIYQIPQILYSLIISSIINTIIKLLSLSEKSIIEIKNEKENIKEKFSKIIKFLIIKFILFFILVFLFLIFFWYYLSCFCAVYKNSQIYLIKDVFLSFGLNLLYPFGLNLLPGIFRIPSLKDLKKNSGCLYKFSKIIQSII